MAVVSCLLAYVLVVGGVMGLALVLRRLLSRWMRR